MKPSLRRPLDGLPSIKWKLGAVIVAAVVVTVAVVDFGVRAGVSPILSGLAAGSLSLLMVQVHGKLRAVTGPGQFADHVGGVDPLQAVGTADDGIRRNINE